MNKAITTVVRPELNLAKYSDFIFPHPKSDGLELLRKRSWTDVDGNNCEIQIATNNSISKPITSNSYKVLLAIFIHIQEKKLDPFKDIPISLRRVAELLEKSWGGRVSHEICSDLRALSTTDFCWNESFKQKNGKTSAIISDFNILNSVEYRSSDISQGHYFRGAQSIIVRLNERIAKNIQENYCIPFDFTTYQGISSKPYFQILYLRLTLYLSSNRYKQQQLSALRILDILNITSNRYFERDRGKYNRKLFLIEAQEWLDKKPLSSNRTLAISVVKTANKDDYKLIINANKTQTVKHFLPVINKDPHKVLDLCHDIRRALGLNYEDLKEQDKKSIRHYCEVYPKNLIEQAITTYKERTAWNLNKGVVIKDKFAYFAGCLHHQAHDSSMPWIKECPVGCKYRNKAKIA